MERHASAVSAAVFEITTREKVVDAAVELAAVEKQRQKHSRTIIPRVIHITSQTPIRCNSERCNCG